MNDATSALLRAMNFINFERVTVEDIWSRSWASATFCGVRHKLTFRLEGDGADAAADAFVDGVEDRDFDLRGHILADIALVSRCRADTPKGPVVRLSLQALTMEDG